MAAETNQTPGDSGTVQFQLWPEELEPDQPRLSTGRPRNVTSRRVSEVLMFMSTN